MGVAGDFEAISIPFAAGTAIAAMISGIIDAGMGPYAASISLSFSILALGAMVLVQGGRRLLPAVFLPLGMFCFLSYASIPSHPAAPQVFSRCAEALHVIIDGIPFRDSSTNALIRALLSGDRSMLDSGTIGTFRASGASHILALSGFHLGIIYLAISRLLIIMGHTPGARIMRSITIILGSGFFTVMTGGNPSTVRAWLFISIGEILRCCPERERDPMRILLTALTIQLIFRPDAVCELGFQLSYLAMCGILLIHPQLESWYPDGGSRIDPIRKIWQSASLSISCQAFTAPLVWIKFHTFPHFFLICNILAMPLTTAIMTTALCTTVLSGIGHCPSILVVCTEALVKLLVQTLEIICSM